VSGRHRRFPEGLVILKLPLQIGFGHSSSIHIDEAIPNFNLISRDAQNSLYKGFAAVFRIPKDDHISPSDILKPVNKAIDEYPFLIYQPRLHACSFNLNRLDHKNHNEDRYYKSKEDIAEPGSQLEHRFEFLSLFFGLDLGSALIVYCQMRFSPQFPASEKPEFKLPDGDAKLKWFVPSFLKGFGGNQVAVAAAPPNFGSLRRNLRENMWIRALEAVQRLANI
jgi:hypothetical protein